MLIGGDFNARTGNKGNFVDTNEERKRESKNKKINAEGEQLIEIIWKQGWYILNGSMEGDEEGEFTFVAGTGQSVIDYAVTNIEGLDRVERFEVGERTESDHMPIRCELKYKASKDSNRKEKEKEIVKWDEESKRVYQIATIEKVYPSQV